MIWATLARMEPDRLGQLSGGQRDCLRLVLRHMSSKQIAAELKISPHTVDQRLKQAMRILGASSRVEAAQALAAAEGHQWLAYQSPDIARARRAASNPPATKRENHHAGQSAERIIVILAGLAILCAAVIIGLNALSDFTR